MSNQTKSIFEQIKEGSHKQFVFDKECETVLCRCSHVAVWWNRNYLCGTITAYPCKYNKIQDEK